MTKTEWISDFQEEADKILAYVERNVRNHKDKASEMNTRLRAYRDIQIEKIKLKSRKETWDKETFLNEILCLTYAFYIIMLTYRNKVWKYEYMAFSRRIGELWEPFCRLPFEYPIRPLRMIKAPAFETVQEQIRSGTASYIDSLGLDKTIQEELKRQYEVPWTMVDSGGIKLGLDLHFEQNGIHYNCDFKSGFSSNEKGNTNRLLLVASIYHYLGETEKTVLFVRQNEDENNHYLQMLKNSPYWQVYCAEESYSVMKQFTGFDMRQWLDTHADWTNDIGAELRQHLADNGLLKYLTW